MKTKKISIWLFLLLSVSLIMGTEKIHATEFENESTPSAESTADGSLISGKRLVYGEESLADEDALVLVMYGDGFTSDEQEAFYSAADNMADYIVETSPWDEVADSLKVYAVGCISEESGIKGENCSSYYEAYYDVKNTYFGTMFWYYGTERLLYFSDEYTAESEVAALTAEYVPYADYEIIVANSTKYGGSGGTVCVASLNSESLEILMHELGHSVANLADEYYAGDYYVAECANMTSESDPTQVSWARFVGKNGVGVYEYTSGGDGWYRPSTSCKMEFLGKDYEFCEVCKEALRSALCQASNITEMFFQTYADEFYPSETPVDMRQYFILRRGDKEITGDCLGDALTLTYYDASGETMLDSAPTTAGTYMVKAVFEGNEIYEACEQVGTYTIVPTQVIVTCQTKVYDGEPITVAVNYDTENYDAIISYSGYQYTTYYDSYSSVTAPTLPGNYWVRVDICEKGSDTVVMSKTVNFQIRIKKTAVTNNNSSYYAGACAYYNNKTILVTGEGFTAEEQEKFETLAQSYISYLREYEPLKECDSYFNYYTVEAVSNTSGVGIGTSEDTYFGIYCDENGQIYETSDYYSYYQAYSLATTSVGYDYQAVIVLVNDDQAVGGLSSYGTIYVGIDESSKEFAAKELVNYLTGNEVGYSPETDEEVETLRESLLGEICYSYSYYGYVYDYPVIVSKAYNENFTENGMAYDLSEYFHTYINNTDYGFMELSGLEYVLTYYTDVNGKPGEKLDSAPTKAGTYHVCAELFSNYDSEEDSWCYEAATSDGAAIYLMVPARGWTTYTIEKSLPIDKGHGNQGNHSNKDKHDKDKHEDSGKHGNKGIFGNNEKYDGFFPLNPNDFLR